MPLLSVLSWGGIGDTLRNLSLVPHEFLHRRLGLRTAVFYKDWRETGAHAHALPPEGAFFRELIGRCPSLRWAGEGAGHKGLGRVMNRALRDAMRLWNGGENHYFPFTIPLTPEETAALPTFPAGAVVGIQTHLNGMHTKRWPVENWAALLRLVLEQRPDVQVVLLDSDPAVAALCGDPRITSTLGLTLPQSIALFRRFQLVASIDSWSKYVAAWQRIPQLVVIPDQRSEYPGLTAEKLARDELSGIWRDPRNRVIGLEGSPRQPRLTLPSLAALEPAQFHSAVAPLLAAVPRPA